MDILWHEYTDAGGEERPHCISAIYNGHIKQQQLTSQLLMIEMSDVNS